MSNYNESAEQSTPEWVDSGPSSEPSADLGLGTVQILAALNEIQKGIEQLRLSEERAHETDVQHAARPGPIVGPGPIELTLATAALSALFATLGTGVIGVLLRALSFAALLLSCLAGFSFFYRYVQAALPEAAKASARIGKVLGIRGLLRLWTLLLKRQRHYVTTPAEDTLLGLLSLALSLLLLAIVLLLWFVGSLAASLITILR